MADDNVDKQPQVDKEKTSEEEREEFHDCEDSSENNTTDKKHDFTDSVTEEDSGDSTMPLLDDFVDEDFIKEEESSLNEEQLKERFDKAKIFKEQGNEEFKAESLENSIRSYTNALLVCPLREKEYRSILYANRSAAKIKYGAKDSALLDCTKSLEYNSNYMKSLIRRAKLYEEMDKLDEALEDYKKIYELDPSNKEALSATHRLPPQIHERNEKLKTEMMGKLKDLGNMVLRPFGLSTNNFQLQPTDAGGYTINFKQ